jgi:hypothetical protein
VRNQRGGGGPGSEEFLIWGAAVEECTLFQRVAVDIHYQADMPHLKRVGEVTWVVVGEGG